MGNVCGRITLRKQLALETKFEDEHSRLKDSNGALTTTGTTPTATNNHNQSQNAFSNTSNTNINNTSNTNNNNSSSVSNNTSPSKSSSALKKSRSALMLLSPVALFTNRHGSNDEVLDIEIDEELVCVTP